MKARKRSTGGPGAGASASTTLPSPVAAAEGDSNLSPHRRAWTARITDVPGRALLDEDARLFLHQSLSTPCLAAIRKADGIWIEDTAGRRYMDFHGNNVHHIGYGHPRLIDAVKRQMDALPFTPRRFQLRGHQLRGHLT